MKLSLGGGGLFFLWAIGCGSAPSFDQRTAKTTEAIQDGTVDVSDAYPFVVALINSGQQVALCSGSLLAPNLVATARHCVSILSGPPQIDCATSTFGSDVPVSQLLVTNDAKISMTGHFAAVTQVLVPSGAQQTQVCGNDIALLILDRNLTVPQYVTPTINPPMTDPRYSIAVAAIGYGIDTPLDTSGMSAGVRRIRQNVGLSCVPNDPSFLGCYSTPGVAQFLSQNEFVSGDASTCEGDSGSGAFDQGSFDRGQWVSFGVLSRGATDADSGTCVQPIYSRFDAWSQLLIAGATQAAIAGGYATPTWARPGGVGDAGASGGQTRGNDAGASNAQALGNDAGPILLSDGTACGADGECQSHNCVSTDNVEFTCANACNAGVCSAGFSCVSAFCFKTPNATAPRPVTHKSGCGAAPISGESDARTRTLALAAAMIAALGLLRRNRGAQLSRTCATHAPMG
jgi:secreted trypsin-like serine protease